MEWLFSTAVLVHFGALFYIFGFLVRDELVLRLLVLAGTLLYIAYYFLHPDTPLWDAIITSIIMIAANLWILFKIIYERTTFALSEEELTLYEALKILTPGQFRTMMKRANWVTADGDELLCEENAVPDRLFYIISGSALIRKGENEFILEKDGFVGEISFVLGGNYSASVIAQPGMRYIYWEIDALKSRMKKEASFSNAMIALFNKDLAQKLAVSHR